MNETRPTIFHVTHWKAGSQWVRKILEACAPGLIVPPQVYETQFLAAPIQEGKVYPTVYVTREQFNSVKLPDLWIRFVIIRDLRDTLVSAYFSILFSHQAIANEIIEWREALRNRSEEEGLLYLMEEWLPRSAVIQESWINSGEKILRYEDLLQSDLQILEDVIVNQCQLPVSRDALREIVHAYKFENLTHGRQRGVEDRQSHERKGISGDWKNHFTDKVKEEFKNKFGQLLIATGYEKNPNW